MCVYLVIELWGICTFISSGEDHRETVRESGGKGKGKGKGKGEREGEGEGERFSAQPETF